MDAVTSVCLIICTVALVMHISAMIFILLEVRRLAKMTETIIGQLEKGVNPLLAMLSKVSEDIACVTGTLRSRVERADLKAEHITESLAALVETCTKTGYLLHDAVAEPLIDVAAFLRGLTRGFKFFFTDRKR